MSVHLEFLVLVLTWGELMVHEAPVHRESRKLVDPDHLMIEQVEEYPTEFLDWTNQVFGTTEWKAMWINYISVSHEFCDYNLYTKSSVLFPAKSFNV